MTLCSVYTYLYCYCGHIAHLELLFVCKPNNTPPSVNSPIVCVLRANTDINIYVADFQINFKSGENMSEDNYH